MTAALATFALPAAALATWALHRSPLGRRVVAEPRGDRWHERQTPLLGGIGLFAGLLVGVGAALAADALEPSKELFGILGGCAIVFAAGLADDLRALPPLAKIASDTTQRGPSARRPGSRAKSATSSNVRRRPVDAASRSAGAKRSSAGSAMHER